jgi:hypothetical protein
MNHTDNSGNHPMGQMLLCDACTDGAHRGCLGPAQTANRAPAPLPGKWLCPNCRVKGRRIEIANRNTLVGATVLVKPRSKRAQTAIEYDDAPGKREKVYLDELRWRWIGPCEHAKLFGNCDACWPHTTCVHGKVARACRHCMCPHGRDPRRCTVCGGASGRASGDGASGSGSGDGASGSGSGSGGGGDGSGSSGDESGDGSGGGGLARGVEDAVLAMYSKNPELIMTELTRRGVLYGSYSEVHRAIDDMSVVRAVKRILVHTRGPTMGGSLKKLAVAGSSDAALLLALHKRPTYSTIVAGKFVREQNYACRLFQVDIVTMPNLQISGGKYVRVDPYPNLWVLSCICVGSRHAWCRVIGTGIGSHPTELKTKNAIALLFKETIVPRYARRVVDEMRADERGVYTAHAYRASAAARLARRDAMRNASAGDRRVTLLSLDRIPVVLGGPDVDETTLEYDVGRNTALSERPFIRHVGTGGPDAQNWLSGLRELTVAAGARREVAMPWERSKPSMIIMTDAKDFALTQNEGVLEDLVALELAKHPGASAPGTHHVHWCVVNKSQLHRKSMHIIERFHRTLRGMISLCMAAHGPVVGPAYRAPHRLFGDVVERVVPLSYNATRHSTTKRRPAELWLAENYFELFSAERPRFASLDLFKRGTRVEVIHGKTGGEIGGKQVVKRYTGLTVAYRNHCTLELVCDDDDENVDIDHPVQARVWKRSPVPQWMCSIVRGSVVPARRGIVTHNPASTMGKDAHILAGDRHSVVLGPHAYRV